MTQDIEIEVEIRLTAKARVVICGASDHAFPVLHSVRVGAADVMPSLDEEQRQAIFADARRALLLRDDKTDAGGPHIILGQGSKEERITLS